MSIRVLLVEDSPIALTVLKRILLSSPDIEVAGTARSGVEALALIPRLQPDVLCTDFFMPQMDGLELTSQVMAHFPLPILVVSASVQEEDDTHRIFQLLEAGAVDVLPKPRAGFDIDNLVLRNALITKVKILSGVKVFRKKRLSETFVSSTSTSPVSAPCRNPKIVLIGASTGGPLALQEILAQLPIDFPLPIICVQHISLGFLQGLIDWLSDSCQLPIQIAREGDRPQPGTVYFPPERQHLELDNRGRFIHSLSDPVGGHRPSVTTTFSSVAQFYRRKTIGVLLTGMGQDGADGMKEIADVGGFTIAQDQETSVVFGMPQAAISLGAVRSILPIKDIAPTLRNIITNSVTESVR